MSIKPVEVCTVIKKSRCEAFEAFTDKVSNWWPLETHSVGPYLDEPAPDLVVIEPHEGGRIFEISPSGVERIWGTITKWDAPAEIEFTWHPGKEEDQATTVNVTFTTSDNGDTLVALTHYGWDILGERAAPVRENYLSGWIDILQNRYASFAQQKMS